jgi:hypothetical protein
LRRQGAGPAANYPRSAGAVTRMRMHESGRWKAAVRVNGGSWSLTVRPGASFVLTSSRRGCAPRRPHPSHPQEPGFRLRYKRRIAVGEFRGGERLRTRRTRRIEVLPCLVPAGILQHIRDRIRHLRGRAQRGRVEAIREDRAAPPHPRVDALGDPGAHRLHRRERWAVLSASTIAWMWLPWTLKWTIRKPSRSQTFSRAYRISLNSALLRRFQIPSRMRKTRWSGYRASTGERPWWVTRSPRGRPAPGLGPPWPVGGKESWRIFFIQRSMPEGSAITPQAPSGFAGWSGRNEQTSHPTARGPERGSDLALQLRVERLRGGRHLAGG